MKPKETRDTYDHGTSMILTEQQIKEFINIKKESLYVHKMFLQSNNFSD